MSKSKQRDSVFSVLYKGLEKGAGFAQKTIAAADRGVQRHEKLRQAREKFLRLSRQGLDKLSQVSISGLKLEDLGEMSFRFTERKLYKLLSTLKALDPNFSWEAYLGHADLPPVMRAYQTLGLDYGASYLEVKRKYRELMRTHHPDRHANDQEKEKEATKRSQALTEAFDIIQKHLGKA